MRLRTNISTFFYVASLVFLFSLSFLYYAPVNYWDFNSDHAIHVLMSKDFQLPRDYFYWGQNRLGSLLPFFAFLLGKVLPMHNLYLCSIIQYLFLGTGFFVMSKFITRKSLKVALCALILLPVNEYNALILIGHPYSSQLFAGSLFVLSLYHLRKEALSTEEFGWKNFSITSLWVLLSASSFGAGIWVSEFNGILILIPIIYIVLERQLQIAIFNKVKNRWFILTGSFTIAFFVGAFSFYKYIKSTCPTQDRSYNKMFIDNWVGIKMNAGFFLQQLERSLLFEDNKIIDNLFNWFLIIVCVFIILFKIVKKRSDHSKRLFSNTLLFVCLTASVILFLSAWNLRADFSPRYFTPVYILFCFALLFMLDSMHYKKWFISAVSFLFVFFCVAYCYVTAIKSSDKGAPFEKYGDFTNLPKGTMIGYYWHVYRIGAVAIDNLNVLAFDNNYVRNMHSKNDALKEANFYFINNYDNFPAGIRNVIFQFGIFFKDSGRRYNCNGKEVRLYHKLIPNQSTKFAIKAGNNMYLTVKPDRLVYADQPDPGKAEIFELVPMGLGNMALKSANGKFTCANLSLDAKIISNSDNAWGWEEFEIISIENTSVNIRSHANGKFICADKKQGNLLFANEDEVKKEAIFILEPR